MDTMRLNKRNLIITGLLAASFGSLATLVITNAIPRMMKRMMAGMMENMAAQMGAEGCKPENI
jgi:hypothetical protein